MLISLFKNWWLNTALWTLLLRVENKQKGFGYEAVRKEMFYLTMHSTHFIYSSMVSDIQTVRGNLLLLFLIISKGSFIYIIPQTDNTYHDLCYISRGTLVETRNSSMGSPWASNPWTHRTMSGPLPWSYISLREPLPWSYILLRLGLEIHQPIAPWVNLYHGATSRSIWDWRFLNPSHQERTSTMELNLTPWTSTMELHLAPWTLPWSYILLRLGLEIPQPISPRVDLYHGATSCSIWDWKTSILILALLYIYIYIYIYKQ